ncbi:hypothetical protein [Branchiibius sp. NY16-3462-2]|uniref:glycosyltransferase family 2 protein n=1 Tax=Branchiibius sp. NY16-3462-2 TaxID=1807500 RepID=UPI000792C3E5|nr:hypothetical protein [Branchiibius sp. NY16-3462-2]KYH44493.1 hypothetical protein AZH51_08260 [Branchiibius sp. NY16-3462-2]
MNQVHVNFGVVTIHYRHPAIVQDLVGHIASWTVQPERVVVVDNSANDDPVTLTADDRYEVLAAPGNVGYAAAANYGLARLRELGLRYALVLTQEARLTSDGVALLIDALIADPAAAVAAPLLEYASAPGTMFSTGGYIHADGRSGHYNLRRPRAECVLGTTPEVVDWADGAILLIDLEKAAEVGDFDPSYFLYVEEIDLQLSLRAAGFHTLMVPAATGYQEPGAYPTYLRYRNQVRLTDKFADSLAPWPWRREMLRDAARFATRRRQDLPELFQAVRGVVDAKHGRLGPPDAAADFSGRSVVIITEFEPQFLHTGVACRLEHLTRLFPDAVVAPIHTGPRHEVSLRARMAAARHYQPPQEAHVTILIALGSPPMGHLARRLHRGGRNVILDVCDAAALQWRARRTAGDPKLLAVGAWMFALQALSPGLPMSYIAGRDADADRWLNVLRPTSIFPMQTSPDLGRLSPFRWPAERIVLSGDFRSFHNQRGLAALCQAVTMAGPDIAIHLFGPTSPTGPLPSGMTYIGWADSTAEILEGNTVAFISNRLGSGVPNKLSEAIVAGRPVIVHRELAPVLSDISGADDAEVFWYDDPSSLSAVLRTICGRREAAA